MHQPQKSSLEIPIWRYFTAKQVLIEAVRVQTPIFLPETECSDAPGDLQS